MKKFFFLFFILVLLTGCATPQYEIQNLKIRVINLESALEKQNQRYEKLEKSLKNLNKKLITMENKLSKNLIIDVKTQIISDLEDLKNEQAVLSSQLEDLKFSQEAQQKEMSSRIEKLSTQIQLLDLKVRKLEKKLALIFKNSSNETSSEKKENISSNTTQIISAKPLTTNATKAINATKAVNTTNVSNTTKVTNATKTVSFSNVTNATSSNNTITNGTSSTAKKIEEKPLSEADLYEKAYSCYQKRDLKNAIKFFEEYIERFPKGKWIGQAYFWIGECYFREKKYEEAILNYQKLIELPGWHPLKPTAMFRQAQAFKALGDIEAYKILLKKVINQYPNSKEAEIAKKLLK